MRQTAFVDKELIELTKNRKGKDIDDLEDWRFLASCLSIGLSIGDLKELKYKDVAKIMIVIEESQNKKTRQATQEDINKFLG